MIKNYICALFLLVLSLSQAQELTGKARLDSLLNVNDIKTAKKSLSQSIEKLKKVKAYDSLPLYIQYVGNYRLSGNSWPDAVIRSERFVDRLLTYKDSVVNKVAYRELAWIYSDAGRPQDAYNSILEALKYSSKNNDHRMLSESDLYYQLGYYATDIGDFTLSRKRYRKSLDLIMNRNPENYTKRQQVYNALGGAMWRVGQIDSSMYYFKKSLEMLKLMEDEPVNQFYRPGLVLMNISVLYNIDGDNERAKKTTREAITKFRKFLAVEKNEQFKHAVKRNLAACLDNLATYYNTAGNFKQAESLLEQVYEIKKDMLPANHPDLLISSVILSQAKINCNELEEAHDLMRAATSRFSSLSQTDAYWLATAYSTLGKIEEQLGNPSSASVAFDNALPLMKKSLKTELNNEIINDYASIATFYSMNSEEKKAVQIMDMVMEFVNEDDFKGSLVHMNQIINSAMVKYQLGNLENAIVLSKQAIDFKADKNQTRNLNDSIVFYMEKPNAYYIHTAARYDLNKTHSVKDLQDMDKAIDQAMLILEQRRQQITNAADLNSLLQSNQRLYALRKKIRLDLYTITDDPELLKQLLEIQDNSVFQRLRARMSLRNDAQFAGVPQDIIEKENQLKADLQRTINLASSDTDQYFKAIDHWNDFLNSLKVKYPKYYNLRYATIDRSLNNFQNNIAGDETIVRYFFIDKDLYAAIITQDDILLKALGSGKLEQLILDSKDSDFDISKSGSALFSLYNLLWEPLDREIVTKKVTIIPDGLLFNLSFESLVKNNPKNYDELVDHCLLQDYRISYKMGLFDLIISKKEIRNSEEFVAFAPFFSNEMKESYLQIVQDSTDRDESYLQLLAQPFSQQLIDRATDFFESTTFLDTKALKQNYLEYANGHNIIHIGTHAFTDNVNPEMSRLVFAKNTSNPRVMEDNALYAFEIYNHDIHTDLAVLTACDTGKPTYQPGEGMISLSHAFAYAGSKSMLTSLWEIDEQSSAYIVEKFYQNLQDDMPKDEALRLAKLSYLKDARSRTRSPQYWAGLVLIGDVDAMEFTDGTTWLWIIAGAVVIAGVFLVFSLSRKRNTP